MWDKQSDIAKVYMADMVMLPNLYRLTGDYAALFPERPHSTEVKKFHDFLGELLIQTPFWKETMDQEG